MTSKVTLSGSKVKSGAGPGTKTAGAKDAPVQILSAPKGPRTVTHRQLKEAVTKVFRDRTLTGA